MKSRNKDKVREQNRKYRQKNKEYCKRINREYRKKVKAKTREYEKEYRKREKYLKWKRQYNKKWTNRTVKNHLNDVLSGAIRRSLKSGKEHHKWNSLVGYTAMDLKKHLESKFDSKMNWGNYGKYWQIDHVTPRSWFKIDSYKDRQFKLCWGLKNLRPLSIKENTLKNNRLVLEA